MKIRNLLSLIAILISSQLLAQPCVDPIPETFICSTAPLFCASELDGFCSQTTNSGFTPAPTSFCGSVENNLWFKFIAAEPTVTIEIETSNCDGTPMGSGLQAEMYYTSSCVSSDFVSVSNCWSNGAVGTGIITGTNLIPGAFYYLMIDGWAGDICDFKIDVIFGIADGPIFNIENIIGELNPCVGAVSEYSAELSNTQFENGVWSLNAENSVIIGDTIGNNVTIQWGEETAAELCVSELSCMEENKVCVTIAAPLFEIFDADNANAFCQGSTEIIELATNFNLENYNWTIPGFGTISDSSANSISIIWEGSGMGKICIQSDEIPCQIDSCISILSFPNPTDTLTFEKCQIDCFNFNNVEVCEGGFYEIPLDNFGDCDSLGFLNVEINAPEIGKDTLYFCSGGGIAIDGVFYNEEIVLIQNQENYFGCDSITELSILALETAIEIVFDNNPAMPCAILTSDLNVDNLPTNWTFEWYNENNGIIGTELSITVCETGNYCIKVFDENNVEICETCEIIPDLNIMPTDCETAQWITNFSPFTILEVDGIGNFENLGIHSCLAGNEHQSHWFTFIPSESGTFEMLVTSIDLMADFDFALFEGGCAGEMGSELIVCNYTGPISPPGPFVPTGIATNPEVSFGQQLFTEIEATVEIEACQQYFLVVDNITGNGVGFSIQFNGTAVVGANVLNGNLEIEGAEIVCENSSEVYSFEPINGISDYTWNIQNGTEISADGDSIEVLWETPGVGMICLESENNFCETFTDCLDILITPDSSEVLTFEVCENECITIAGNEICGEGFYEFPTNAQNSCDSLYTIFLDEVNNAPEVTISGNQIICQDSAAQLSASSDTGTEFFWQPADGLSCQTCLNPIATPDTTTTYQVLVTNDTGCTSLAATTIFVSNIESQTFTIDTTACHGDTLELSVDFPLASSYLWSTASNLSCSTCPNPTTIIQGDATLFVTIFDANGCEGLTGLINIDQNCAIAQGEDPPNSLMGNTDIDNLEFADKFQKNRTKNRVSNFKIFPNPTSGQLFLHSNNEKLIEIEILNFNGKSVKRIVPKSTNIEMNLETLPVGVYLIKMKTEKEIWVETILKIN